MTDQEEKIFQKLHVLSIASKRALNLFTQRKDLEVWESLKIVEMELLEAKKLIGELKDQ